MKTNNSNEDYEEENIIDKDRTNDSDLEGMDTNDDSQLTVKGSKQ